MVLEKLQTARAEGNTIKLPEQLDRPTYNEVAKMLKKIGGTWKGGKTQAFVFDFDPAELLAQIQTGKKIDLKQDFQFFETPVSLANEMAGYLSPKNGNRILEPSAGRDRLIDAVLNLAPLAQIDYVEKMDQNRWILHKKYNGCNIWDLSPEANDYLLLREQAAYDGIIANPPFKNNQDIDHVWKMYRMLKPGGRLVAITSTHWYHHSGKKENAFKDWINTVDATLNSYDAGTFDESGTSVKTFMLIADK